MKQVFLILVLLSISFTLVNAGDELTSIWEKSITKANLPKWFDTANYTRGLDYGKVGGNDRLYVVSRNGGSFIYILNPATGDSVGKLDNTGITGGTYAVSDVGVSTDGIIFVCNLASGGIFKVYEYTSEIAAPVAVINFDATGKRLGDKLTVTGALNDNSLVIWAASSTTKEVFKFTTADTGKTYTSEVIPITAMGASPSAGPIGGSTSDFYYNATGVNPLKYSAAGAELAKVPGTVVATGSNAIRYLGTVGSDEYFVTYAYGAGNENARIVKAPNGDANAALLYSVTPTLGTNANTNGAGDVAVKNNGDGTYTVYVLSCNNGLGGYLVKFPVPPISPVNLALNWEANNAAYAFFKNDNNTRGIAYNPGTDHLLVASRTGTPAIYALDANTGALVDTLDVTGVTGGTYALNKVGVDYNGVIYVGNLALANQEYKLYRWEDETAVPTVAFAGTVTGRVGDVLAVIGDSVNTIIYASGSTNTQVLVFTTTDGLAFTNSSNIPVAAGTARGGIAPVADTLGAPVWINGSGTTLRQVASDGAVLNEVDGAVVAASWMNAAYIGAANGAEMVLVNGNNIIGDRRKLQVWDVTESASVPKLWATGETGNIEVANTNGTGELATKYNEDGTYTIFQLTSNNALAAWKLLEVPEVINILTIEEARQDTNNDYQPDLLGQEVILRGVINSPNYGTYTQYYMQDESAGIVLYSGKVALALKMGDQIQVKGKIAYYRGVTEIEPTIAEDVVVLSSDNKLVPEKVSIADIGEATEARLMQVDSVWFIDPTKWPVAGKNGSVYLTDGQDTTYIFIDKETELDGWQPPEGLMTIIAVTDQYTTSASIHNDGYSLRGTIQEHFIDINDFLPALPLSESASEGKLDLPWEVNTVTAPAKIYVADSTASAWGSHVIVFDDETDHGMVHVKDALFKDYTISADFYLKGEPSVDFPLYTGLGIKMKHDELRYYRLVFRNSTASDNGQLRLQAYNGTSFFISKYWNPDKDFERIATGWHNLKVTVSGYLFWAFLDGVMLPGCPYEDPSQTLAEGYPGIYKYNSGAGRVIFDNFEVVEPVIPPPPEPQSLYTFWAKTQAAGSFPAYMSTSNYTRGMAYGMVDGKDRVYVVTRSGLHRIVIYDALTGDSLGVIPKPTQAEGVGLFHLNAVDVSDDGIIFASNMTLKNDAVNPFRVYRWDNETATPVTAISYDAGLGRMGDMFSVYGSAVDNSLVLYAGVTSGNQIVKFTTKDQGQTFTPHVITLPSGALGTSPNVADPGDGTLYIKSYGQPLVHYDTLGVPIDTVSGAVVGTSASKIQYAKMNNEPTLIVYYPDVAGAGSAEKINIVNIAHGSSLAYVQSYSASMGKIPNGNGTGSVDYKKVDDATFLFFALGTNNGLAAFSNQENYVLANLDTLFYGDTATLTANPYGAGFVAGTNSNGDIGKYQRFDFKTGDVLHAFRYFFAHKMIVDTPDTLHLVIKSVAANGAPDLTLHTLQTTTDKLDTTLVGNVFLLDSPMTLAGPVFIGFEWSTTANDTFALYIDTKGEGEKANRAWEKFSDGQYNDFQGILRPDFSWGLDVDLWIAAYYVKARISDVSSAEENAMPTGFVLNQNYPNPFNPITTFSFTLPSTQSVEIVIYNVIGQKVAEIFNGKLTAGLHKFEFDARSFSSGIYFYQVKTTDFTAVKKMTLLK